ncbi:MAG: hypothetical protein O7C56_01605 [Rickettsia endosymbiont of Ixodes persulcatus]|nr:hypothetical protein [Rickettsia endosymbiont of Ixodes persulcatus]
MPTPSINQLIYLLINYFINHHHYPSLCWGFVFDNKESIKIIEKKRIKMKKMRIFQKKKKTVRKRVLEEDHWKKSVRKRSRLKKASQEVSEYRKGEVSKEVSKGKTSEEDHYYFIISHLSIIIIHHYLLSSIIHHPSSINQSIN